jgi:hypothetical protein
MTHYRITFEDRDGASASGGFEAKDDQEASAKGKTFLPPRTSGYEIWRDEGSRNGQLVFAEWHLVR